MPPSARNRQKARKLGAYLGLSPQVIASAVEQQIPSRSGAPRRRLGDILVDSDLVSREALEEGIRLQRVDRLRACPLFSSLSDEDVAELGAGFHELSIAPGAEIITQGRRDPTLYVLATGRLEVLVEEDGEETRVAAVYPGEPIGEMAYFSGGLHSVTVRAVESSELLRASYDDLTRVFESAPGVAQSFIQILSGRMRHSTEAGGASRYRGRIPGRSLGHLGAFVDLTGSDALGSGVEGLIERLVDSASRLTDADRGSLFLVDAETGELWSKVAQGSEVAEIRIPAGTGVAGWVVEHNELLNVADAYDDERFNPEVDRRTGYRTRTILCAPVRSLRNSVLGVVQVINKHTGAFNEDDEALLRAFADQAGAAVENFNAYNRMLRSHERLLLILDVATLVSEAPDFERLVLRAGHRVEEILRCDRVTLFLFDRESDELWSVEGEEEAPTTVRFPVPSLLAGHVVSGGGAINVADAYEDPRFDPASERSSGYRTRSIACVPVTTRRGRTIGALEAVNKVDGEFDDGDVDLLRAIAAQLGVAALLAP